MAPMPRMHALVCGTSVPLALQAALLAPGTKRGHAQQAHWPWMSLHVALSLAGMCETPKLTIAKQHISSASLTGPYWNDVDFSPLLAIPEVPFRFLLVCVARL